jgi:heat shock protein HslJ
MHKASLLLFVFILLTASCHTSKKGKMTPTPEEDKTVPDMPITGDARLHDIWVVTAMGEKAIPEALPKPRLEIFPGEGRVAGNGSCNELFGQCQVVGRKISFSQIGTTKMFCQETLGQESQFLALLQEVDNYEIRHLQLFLRKGDQLLLTLQKVD